MHDYREVLLELQKRGWKVVVDGTRAADLKDLRQRYRFIPRSYERFLDSLKLCANEDDTAWFLTSDDFGGRSDSAFRWNEFELQSLEAAQGDPEWEERIRRFWDLHLPIVLSVKSGYAYFALNARGEVVHGAEPEYEETAVVAPSFESFLTVVSKGGHGLPPGVL